MGLSEIQLQIQKAYQAFILCNTLPQIQWLKKMTPKLSGFKQHSFIILISQVCSSEVCMVLSCFPASGLKGLTLRA